MQEKNEFLDNIDDYSDATDAEDDNNFEDNPTDSPPSLDDTEESSETVDDEDSPANEPDDEEDYLAEDTQLYEESNNYTESEGANEESDGSNKESNYAEAENTTADDENISSVESDNEDNSSSSEDERDGFESFSSYRETSSNENTEDESNNNDNNENTETEDNHDEDSISKNNTVVPIKNKKSKRTIAAVVISIFVVLLVVLGYFVFFNKNVTGAWRVEDTNSDVISVLVLNPDGSAKFTTGSLAVSGTYKLNSKDVMTLDISTDEVDIFKGDYTCRVSSGFMNRTMELISSSSGKVRKCKQYELKELIHPVNNFTPKAELLGKWSNSSSGYFYEFKDNGIVVVSKGNETVTLTYFVDDTSIKLMQYFYKDTAEDDTVMDKVSYTLKDGTLIIGGLMFKKVA